MKRKKIEICFILLVLCSNFGHSQISKREFKCLISKYCPETTGKCLIRRYCPETTVKCNTKTLSRDIEWRLTFLDSILNTKLPSIKSKIKVIDNTIESLECDLNNCQSWSAYLAINASTIKHTVFPKATGFINLKKTIMKQDTLMLKYYHLYVKNEILIEQINFIEYRVIILELKKTELLHYLEYMISELNNNQKELYHMMNDRYRKLLFKGKYKTCMKITWNVFSKNYSKWMKELDAQYSSDTL